MGWPQLLIIAVKPRFHYNIGMTTMHFLCVVPTLGFLPEASHNRRVSLSLTTTTHPRAVRLSSLSLLVRLALIGFDSYCGVPSYLESFAASSRRFPKLMTSMLM